MSKFEEINRWIRHGELLLWSITSIFVGGNLFILKFFCSYSLSDTITKITSISMIILWLIFIYFATKTIIASHHFMNKIDESKNESKKDIVFEFNTKFVCKILKYPWSLMVLVLTIIFVLTWIFILIN